MNFLILIICLLSDRLVLFREVSGSSRLPYEQAFSLRRFVHKPYFLRTTRAREHDTILARFQSMLRL